MRNRKPVIGVIADDLTGCGDAGVFLKQAGLTARIIIDGYKKNKDSFRGCDAILLNTDSRLRTSSTAYKRVTAAAHTFKKNKISFVFKKIDSTLRGNIGAELDACFDVFKMRSLPLVAAFPHMGRTTKNAVQYVHGRILTETFFGKDPRNTVETAHIPALLRKTARHAHRIAVLDAVRNADLKRIARIYHSRIFAGAAGILEYLLAQWKLKRKDKTNIYNTRYNTNDILIVCGSMHPVNERQVQEVIGRKKGLTDRVITVKKGGRSICIVRGPKAKKNPEDVARELTDTVSRLVSRKQFGRVILIGGDVSQHICHLLRIRYLDITHVLEKGIVSTRSNTGLIVILKPGGFGDRYSLLRCISNN